MKNLKFLVLRIMLLLALFGAWIGTCFVKKAYHFPVEWLLHYLVGTGKDKKVPDYIVVGAKSALERAMKDNDYNNMSLSGMYCVNHSTLYEGSGFHGRPTLFYLLGGFSFYYDEATNRVSGHDYYDWHSNGDGNYFTSPLGEGKIMAIVVKIAGKLFGEDLFVTNGWPSGETGISNKLWEEFYSVGAKSFNSVFDCYIEFDAEFLDEVKSMLAYNYFEEVVIGEDGSYRRIFNIDEECNKSILKIYRYDEEGYQDVEYVYYNFETSSLKRLNEVETQLWISKENKRRVVSRDRRNRRRPSRVERPSRRG